ncbi:MAG: YybS family protein [Bdellovibrionaceae bacterium]|nr:YybS family protein [Pseudobdellovibrionaceae bacterium]
MILLVSGVILTVLTLVMGALPMRLARRTYGRSLFWLGHGAVAIALYSAQLAPFALAFALMAILVGSYAELEGHAGTVFTSGLLAIAMATGVGAATLAIWLHQTKADLTGLLKTQVNEWVAQMVVVNPQVTVNVDTLVQQTPSVALVMLTLALAASLIWERRGYVWFRLPQPERMAMSLSNFRVPDVFVWITMAAILGAFLQHGRPLWEIVSLNALNALVVIYFLQGLAVVASFFRTIRLSPLWQGFWYIMIAFQLFLLVALLGFADFWMEFRTRLAKKTTEIKKSI